MAAFGIVGDNAERPNLGRKAAIRCTLNERLLSRLL
jgi:hypothetical protein